MSYRRARIAAFFFDIMFVLFLTILVANVNFLNPYLDDLESATEKYDNVYQDFMSTTDLLEQEKLSGELMRATKSLEKTNLFLYIYFSLFTFIYFIIFQWWNGGQTLGKKLFKLKVVNDNEDNPNFIQFVIRTLFNGSSMLMGVNFVLILKVIILLMDLPTNVFMIVYSVLSILAFVIELLLIITLFTNKDGKLFNDKLAKTKVIYLQ